MASPTRPVGIMCAMEGEANRITALLQKKEEHDVGMHKFTTGVFEGTPVVFTVSGIGKVDATLSTTLLKTVFNVQEIVLTGVAGGAEGTQMGDVVVGCSTIQHDLGATPVSEACEVISLKETIVYSTEPLVTRMQSAVRQFFTTAPTFPDLGITSPALRTGTIASGEQFIGTSEAHQAIVEKTSHLFEQGTSFLAIDMESGAVAQACRTLGVDFVIVRTISDNADHKATDMFMQFMQADVPGTYSLGILREYFAIRQSES